MGAGKILAILAVLTLAPPLALQSPTAGSQPLASPQGMAPGIDLMLGLGGTATGGAPRGPAPLGLQPPSPDTVFPPDNRTRITPTTSFPWRTVAKLLIYTASEATPSFECSGVLVSPIHVLTAGHCVYDQEFTTPDHWAARIQVIPASESRETPSGPQGVEPYGDAFATTMRALPNWVSSWDYRADLALLTLGSPLGNRTGWLDLRADFLWSPAYRGTLYSAGYPGDRDGARNLYSAVGKGCRVTQDNLWFSIDTAQGQSGSPVFAYIGPRPYVLAIITYGSTGCNIGTRLGEGKLETLLDWMRADNGGTPPLEYVDLTTPNATAASFTPTSATAGVTRLVIAHQVLNQGTEPSGPFTVAYYASSDPTIDTSDLPLGNQVVGSLAPGATIDVRWSGTVPTNLTAGRYWIGWILEVGGNVSEIDEENNAAYVGSSQLSAAPTSTLLRPASLAALAALIVVPLALLVLVLAVSRRRSALHPAWVPQQLPPPPPDAPQPVWRYCGHCGTPFLPAMGFCVNCGARLP